MSFFLGNNPKIINTSIDGNKKIVIGFRDRLLINLFIPIVVKLNHKDKSEINVRNLDGPFKYLENNWKFIAVNEFECEIQFNIDFELNVRLFDILMKKFFDLAFQKMVDAFISRANDIY